MPCPDANTVSRYVGGALAVVAARAVEAHLDGCAECRRLVAMMAPQSGPESAGAGPTLVDGQALGALPVDQLIGTVHLDYRVNKKLGSGGMGVVYEAQHVLIGRRAALKVLRADVAADPDFARRLLDEARLTNLPQHAGLVDVFGFGQLPDGRPFMLMELLAGRSLYEVLKERKRLPAREALQIVAGVLDPLAATHAAGVVHRDLKPSNIFLLDGPGLSVKLLDFGVAKSTQLSPSQGSPQTLAGTPGFMAPEQLKGSKVTPMSDLYALGCVLFEMLTGRPPFDGPTPFERMRKHTDSPAPPPSQVVPISPAVDAFVLSLLEKDPAARPGSALAARQRVLALLDDAELDAAPARRTRTMAWLAAGATLAAAAGAAAWLLYDPPIEPQAAPVAAQQVAVPAPQPEVAPARVEPATAPTPAPAPAPVVAAPPKKDRKKTARPAVVAAAPAEDGLRARKASLERRLTAVDAWIARAREQGRPTDFQETTAGLIRRKLAAAKTDADVDALETVASQLEAGAR